MGDHETPFFYKHFIDDGFGLLIGSLDTLKKFAKYANSIHKEHPDTAAI